MSAVPSRASSSSRGLGLIEAPTFEEQVFAKRAHAVEARVTLLQVSMACTTLGQISHRQAPTDCPSMVSAAAVSLHIV